MAPPGFMLSEGQSAPTKIPDPQPGQVHRADLIVLLVICLGVSAAAITTQSFWLDEAGTAYKAMQTSLRQWWLAMRSEGNSNLQLPLYMLYSWAWEKLSGSSEAALRAANVPWLAIGLLIFAKGINDRTLRWGASLFVLFSPFVWYYLDDARPYTVQLGCSLALLGSIWRLRTGPDGSASRGWLAVFAASSVLLCASGLLAMLWVSAYFSAAASGMRRGELVAILKKHLWVWITTAILLTGIGSYYLWTLSLGARASAAATDIRNVFFIAYELLGFTGMGPGRLELRTGGLGSFRPWVPYLCLHGVAIVLLIAAAFPGLGKGGTRLLWSWTVAFALVAALLLTVGVVAHFRVLGRHCTPVFPLIALVCGMGVSRLLRSKTPLWKGVAAASLLVCLASCLGVRLGERHAKDDYRGAAAIARAALDAGLKVWWNADEQGALVYGVQLASPTNALKSAHFVRNPEPGFEMRYDRPDVVVSSKPDIYDNAGVLAAHLSGQGYSRQTNLMAFSVWRSPEHSAK